MNIKRTPIQDKDSLEPMDNSNPHNNRVEVISLPQAPKPQSALHKTLNKLGYTLVGRDREIADLVIHCEDATFPRPQHLPQSRWGVPPVNGRCPDISKKRVDAVAAEVFGYPLNVDPLTFDGPCIEKSNLNARHETREVTCPGFKPAPNKVYQRLIDLSQPDGHLVELRIFVVGDELPVCVRKLRPAIPLPERIEHGPMFTVQTAEVLSDEDQRLILKFCRAFGLDFGALDAGRDRSDGRLYVFDANTTPCFTSTRRSTEEDRALIVDLLAAAFARQFQPQITFA